MDEAALRAARDGGLEIGGWCPPGRVCESGTIPFSFPLTETPDDRSPLAPDVPRSLRTEWNVRDADATLVLALSAPDDAGTRLTFTICDHYKKRSTFVSLSDPAAVRRISEWLEGLHPQTLNVAGPSEKNQPGVADAAYAVLRQVFSTASTR